MADLNWTSSTGQTGPQWVEDLEIQRAIPYTQHQAAANLLIDSLIQQTGAIYYHASSYPLQAEQVKKTKEALEFMELLKRELDSTTSIDLEDSESDQESDTTSKKRARKPKSKRRTTSKK